MSDRHGSAEEGIAPPPAAGLFTVDRGQWEDKGF